MKPEIWKYPKQKYTSAKTSVNNGRCPATLRIIPWQTGTRNADIGGGRFDNFTLALKEIGVDNFIYDPFNRSLFFNRYSLQKIRNHQCQTCTVNSVLNVVRESEFRHQIILQAFNVLRKTGTAYFLIYEGDKTGIGRETLKTSWQNNRRTESYIKEIRTVFQYAYRKGNLIIANP